jgi:hypothetical protein
MSMARYEFSDAFYFEGGDTGGQDEEAFRGYLADVINILGFSDDMRSASLTDITNPSSGFTCQHLIHLQRTTILIREIHFLLRMFRQCRFSRALVGGG